MSVKHVLTITLDDENHQYKIDDEFITCSVSEMTGLIGIISTVLHTWQHQLNEEYASLKKKDESQILQKN